MEQRVPPLPKKRRGESVEVKDAFELMKQAAKRQRIAENRKQRANNDAFRTMTGGRPGPVSIEMCWDTMAEVSATVDRYQVPPTR